MYGDLDDNRALGVVQNLRYGGLYQGPTTRIWNPQLAQAINQAHFDLDFIDEAYNFETEAGMAGFVRSLSYANIRPRLASELSAAPPEFQLLASPAQAASVVDGQCEIDGGSYGRAGEQMQVTFWARGRNAGIRVQWDGWPGGPLSPITVFGHGENAVPISTESVIHDGITKLEMFQQNGWWVTNMMQESDRIDLNLGDDAGEIILPSGDLYRTGMALEECARS
ncbi:hypothetical protein AAW00_13270 [Aurantiacibacter luteus]|uniref:Uncharacterized protein n=1 Tax=Aurantiacibacter luteus TaxID=1581420 RepID=A0A0G9MSV6_9SPHN|nr:hypothetical protein AAW00_13270 [Aurantiacibacter luteus]